MITETVTFELRSGTSSNPELVLCPTSLNRQEGMFVIPLNESDMTITDLLKQFASKMLDRHDVLTDVLRGRLNKVLGD